LVTALPDVAITVYGKGYNASPALVQWLLLSSLFVGLASPLSAVIASADRMWVSAVSNLGWGALYLICAVRLVPVYKATGLGSSYALAYGVIALVSVAYLYYRVRQFMADVPWFKLAALVLLLDALCVCSTWLRIAALPLSVGLLSACVCAGVTLHLLKKQFRASF
jgi:O-antigen/teichoic acid export membrane protein